MKNTGFSMVSHRRHRRFRGFTMIEIVIILAVIGIVSILAAPSFGQLLESIKVDQAITEMRTTFSDTQRAAIRAGEPCITSLVVQTTDSTPPPSTFKTGIFNTCSASEIGEDLPEGISAISNLVPRAEILTSTSDLLHPLLSPSDTETGAIGGGDLIASKGSSNDLRNYLKRSSQWACEHWGWCEDQPDNPEYISLVDVRYSPLGEGNFEVQSDNTAIVDSTGKIVAFPLKYPSSKQRCIAVSRNLGLTRVGTYRGPLTPAGITDEGHCTAHEWSQQ